MTNLSQDEINALLNPTENSDESASSSAPAVEDFIAPEAAEEARSGEIPGALESPIGALDDDIAATDVLQYLTPEEVDLLGEVGNICMGAVATTMYTLLDRRVSITTPRVHVYSVHDVLKSYRTPYIVVDVRYIEGIEGKNLLLLKKPDAILITDLLMGGDGSASPDTELNELHMSAISEIMNQMIASSATALSQILSRPINISPPNSTFVDINTDVSGMLDASELVIKISFDMEIEGLLKSQLLQLMPYSLGRDMAAKLMEVQSPPPLPEPEPEPIPAAPEPPAPPASSYAPPAEPSYSPPPYSPPPQAAPSWTSPPHQSPVDVRHVSYPSFDEGPSFQDSRGGMPKSFDLVSDIPLSVSVELGKTKKTINEILEFGIGTIVVLDKIAGEHVEVLVNGKLIAAGEVVVIDENYGVRITDIFDT